MRLAFAIPLAWLIAMATFVAAGFAAYLGWRVAGAIFGRF